jgi:Zinc-binding dehydrogenase
VGHRTRRARGAGPRARRHADDYQREDFTHVLPGGFDVVFDGIGENGGRRSLAALRRGGQLCACGYTAGVQAQRRMFTILMLVARLYLSRWLPGGKRVRFYSINAMRARHPAWFRQDLERLFELLATRAIRPRVAERISFDEVAEAHRRLEAGGLEGKLVLCPDLPPRRDPAPPQREPGPFPSRRRPRPGSECRARTMSLVHNDRASLQRHIACSKIEIAAAPRSARV